MQGAFCGPAGAVTCQRARPLPPGGSDGSDTGPDAVAATPVSAKSTRPVARSPLTLRSAAVTVARPPGGSAGGSAVTVTVPW